MAQTIDPRAVLRDAQARNRAGVHRPSWDEKRNGQYGCVCCGAPLFSSATKYDSGTGWPSFWAPVEPSAVGEHVDRFWFMRRTEIRCATCDAHLGHVFPDGPKPTGQRYCMNGTALRFALDASDT